MQMMLIRLDAGIALTETSCFVSFAVSLTKWLQLGPVNDASDWDLPD